MPQLDENGRLESTPTGGPTNPLIWRYLVLLDV
jgi:hypothetical protein